MPARLVPHALRVRSKSALYPVAVRHIYRFELARRAAELLAEFLAEKSTEFTAAPRWAFAVRDELEAAGAELRTCVVEVLRGRRGRGKAGKWQWRAVARAAVNAAPRSAA
jgi:hypothetical protein